MRILWHSNGPGCNTGYGRQTAHFVPLLAGLGHEVAISAFHGVQGGPSSWRGFPVYPGSLDGWGMETVAGHYRHWRADVLITLMDTWRIDPAAVAGLNMACWTPVDCTPLSQVDRALLKATGAVPVAVSRHGETMMAAAALEPLYVPHGVDTAVFRPLGRDRSATFTVGMCAANQDKRRKGFDEAFQAFGLFRGRHPQVPCRLLVHSRIANLEGDGLDLQALAAARGIADAVVFTDQYAYQAGLVGDDGMAEFYSQIDVLLNPSLGEGFGLPVLEAQACGVPVVVTRASAMTELCGAGWSVPGQKTWGWLPAADWVTPDVQGLAAALARARTAQLADKARQFAMGYDVRRVLEEYWRPALECIATRFRLPAGGPRTGS